MPENFVLDKFLIAAAIFFVTDIFVWFQINGYKVFDIMNKYQIPFVMALSIPIGLGYLYAWKFAYAGLGSWWSCRLMGFGISFLVFPALTHYFLGESMFRPKILICILLSLVIVGIQVSWVELPQDVNEENNG